MLTIKQFRNKYHMTLRQLAEEVGTTPTTISKYEKGEWMLNQAVIDTIREKYGKEIRPLLRRR